MLTLLGIYLLHNFFLYCVWIVKTIYFIYSNYNIGSKWFYFMLLSLLNYYLNCLLLYVCMYWKYWIQSAYTFMSVHYTVLLSWVNFSIFLYGAINSIEL